MTVNFWWVRHGPTHEKAFVGQRDVPADLSDTAQIARLDDYLPDRALIISSDLSRAADTASSIATTRTRLPHDPDLREFDFGDWDGRHFSAVAETHPGLSRQFWEQPGDVAPPNGESWNEVRARVDRAVDRLIAAHPGQDIIAVAHIGVIMTQIQRAGGLSAADTLAHRIDNFSVTRLSVSRGVWHLGQVNHLP